MGPLIKAARQGIQKVLETKLQNVRFDLKSSKELDACIQLLKTNGLGYRSPSPPPPERTRRDADEFDEWENEINYMMRKDKASEDRMNAAYSAAKQNANR